MRNLTVETTCNLCGKTFMATRLAYLRAVRRGRLPYCSQKCGRFLRKSKTLTLDEAIQLKGEKLWKGTVTFNCTQCGKESSAKYNKLVSRKYGKQLPICSGCICKWTTNLPIWKDKNSKAQLVAQNRPGQRDINRQSVIEACKRHDVIQRKKDALKLKWQDPVFREKGLNHLRDICCSDKQLVNSAKSNRFLSGYYVLKNGDYIFYCSGWELMYIKFCDDHLIPIQRCSERICYVHNGKQKIYLPDFVIEYCGRKIIIEIKGKYPGSADTVESKKIAALSFVSNSQNYDDYVIYLRYELERIGIDLRIANIRKVHDETVKNYQNHKASILREGL